MELHFSKWEGTGNDFVLIDDRTSAFPIEDTGSIEWLCDRHFGVGSDGLILIQPPRPGFDYHMEFYNPDGSRSFCGNGSRCAFAYWRSLQGDDPAAVDGAHLSAAFTAIDGEHRAEVRGALEVAISLRPPTQVERIRNDVDLIHTGSPHLLVWVEDPEQVDILREAHVFRYGEQFEREGVNVNFLRWNERDRRLEMRTYERGVENETLSCGTGVTAAALDAIHRRIADGDAVTVRTKGGVLRVEARYDEAGGMPRSVALVGPVREVFTGRFHR